MTSIIDIIFILVFFVVYKIVYSFETKGDFQKKIKTKTDNLAVQSNKLHKSFRKEVSTLTKSEHIEFWSSPGIQSGIVSKIRLFLEKANVKISVYGFIIFLLAGGSLLAAAIIHFKFLDMAWSILVGMCVWALLVYGFLIYLINKRKKEFLKLFPDAIDMMVRGCKAGLNVVHIMRLISTESRDSVAGEFKIISQKFDMGIEPGEVLAAAVKKIDIEEFQFLVIALVLQMENGGVLAEILQDLAGIVRKRLEFDLKLKALSAEAKMSAVIISLLPFVFALVMAIINPNYFKEFNTPGLGRELLKIAIILFGIGTVVMWRVAKVKV
ncbi:MAG: type II secretion system F family protein [Holosporaceae bacterium]|jgi:tight adherence protein B|nr:type II secretion system F family protein [Holosporaceae bacterium]